MDIEKCKNCGKEIENTTSFCPFCGFKNNHEKAYAKEESINNKKKKIIITSIISLVVLAIIASGTYLFIVGYYLPRSNYEKGIYLMEQQNYEEAIEAFKSSNGYSDSDKKILESKYNIGLSLIKKKNYEEAIKVFNELNGYSDSDEKIIEIEKEQKRIDVIYKLRCAYQKCSYERTKLSSDGLNIYIDSKDKNDIRGVSDIITIIAVLNIPDSLLGNMLATNTLMGVQKQTYGNYEVSWSYNTYSGLDATFRVIE